VRSISDITDIQVQTDIFHTGSTGSRQAHGFVSTKAEVDEQQDIAPRNIDKGTEMLAAEVMLQSNKGKQGHDRDSSKQDSSREIGIYEEFVKAETTLHKKQNQRVRGYSSYIGQVMDDFSLALHDEVHVRPNRSQVTRLFQAYGLDENGFVGLMYEAKQRTQWAAIAGKGKSAATPNRAAYFFTVLRNLLAGQAQSALAV
jgi:hypothetical protein